MLTVEEAALTRFLCSKFQPKSRSLAATREQLHKTGRGRREAYGVPLQESAGGPQHLTRIPIPKGLIPPAQGSSPALSDLRPLEAINACRKGGVATLGFGPESLWDSCLRSDFQRCV
jgi:hypothetical protein